MMRLVVDRKDVKVYPDPKRVIARFFFNGDQRANDVVSKIMKLKADEVFAIVSPILQEYSKRHRNISKILYRHCKKLKALFEKMGIEYQDLETHRRLLIGAYFTHEYSIESAAFFNPSIIEDPDQSELVKGQKRIIISFRAVGEGHISSIVFRRALLDCDNSISVTPVGDYVDEAEVIKNATYNKKLFLATGLTSLINKDVLSRLNQQLEDNFDYETLKSAIGRLQETEPNPDTDVEFNKVLWLSDSYYDITFSLDTDLSDRVIFPISEFERKGIEDARFTKFTDTDGSSTYFATYTAYDGHIILPKLLSTKDFYKFSVGPLFGDGAQNKNLALFPRKIKGKYVMLSRIDGINNYIMYSNKINVWENPVKFQEPKFPWEFIQIGNCGSPIETSEGWLVITHAVGPMRRYCLSACLLDLEDPSIEIGRLDEPLLIPNNNEREGYVPNVVYSCGSIVHNGQLIIPYGLSDYSSSFASIELKTLLNRLKSPPSGH